MEPYTPARVTLGLAILRLPDTRQPKRQPTLWPDISLLVNNSKEFGLPHLFGLREDKQPDESARNMMRSLNIPVPADCQSITITIPGMRKPYLVTCFVCTVLPDYRNEVGHFVSYEEAHRDYPALRPLIARLPKSL